MDSGASLSNASGNTQSGNATSHDLGSFFNNLWNEISTFFQNLQTSSQNGNVGSSLGPDIATFFRDLCDDLTNPTPTISGTSGGDTVDLSGKSGQYEIELRGNAASAPGGLNNQSVTISGTPDAVSLGTGATEVEYALLSTSGVETISNFQYGVDQLSVQLYGAPSSDLKAFDTTVNGSHAISIYNTNDPTHGILLLGVPNTYSANDLLSKHTVFKDGLAVIS